MTSRDFSRSRERAAFRATRPLGSSPVRPERTLVRHPYHDLPLRAPADRNSGRLGLRWFRAVVRFLFPGQGRRLSSRGAVVVCSAIIGLTSIVLARSGILPRWPAAGPSAVAEDSSAARPQIVRRTLPREAEPSTTRGRPFEDRPNRIPSATLDAFETDGGISRASFESTFAPDVRALPHGE